MMGALSKNSAKVASQFSQIFQEFSTLENTVGARHGTFGPAPPAGGAPPPILLLPPPGPSHLTSP
jgi:hypothetical protein